MARTKTTRRTYENKKLQAIGNAKEAERARVEQESVEDVGVGQTEAHPIIESSDTLPDQTDPVGSEENALQRSPILGSSLVSRQTTLSAIDLSPVTPRLQERSPILGCSQRNVPSRNTVPAPVRQIDTSFTSPTTSEAALAWDATMKENSQLQANFRPITPDMSNIPVVVDEIFSPKTQNQLRSSIRALFPNGPPPPPPVKPIRRPKKGDKPYIVDCTKRPRVPSPKCLNVFRGDDYGITDKTNCDEDEQCSPAKRGRRGPKGSANLSKSRFNPQSNEIAERLKMHEKIDRLLGRTPKEETVGYMSKPSTSRTFSPIPSTSTDSETIMKNDRHFSESLNCDSNFDIDDDEDLPEIMWDTSKCKQENFDRNDSPIPLLNKNRSLDIERETDNNGNFDNSPTGSSMENNIDVNDISGVELNEELNNNNNNNNNDDVVVIDNDFCEIDFDKYLPKEKLIITDEEENNAAPKREVIETIEIIDCQNRTPACVIPSTSSTDVICIDDAVVESNVGTSLKIASAEESADPGTSTVLKASNKIPTATESTPEVIEVPDAPVITAITPSQTPASRLPVWNEDVQFVSETRANEPRPLNETQTSSTAVRPSQRGSRGFQFLSELQRFFDYLSDPTSLPSNHKRAKRKSKRTKRQPCASPSEPINNENTAPLEIQASPANEPNQPPSSSVSDSPSNGKKLGDCPICLESLSRGFIASTNCGHVFCLDCIKKSLSTSGKRCPTCRKQLKGTGYHQVFL